ncbi:MAG: hypothetical protein AB1306_11885 [Nitrospirota bacterium]
MNKLFFFLVVLLIGCSQRDINAVEINDTSSGKATREISIGEKGKVKLRVDLKEEKELQDAVDKGHQPWRQVPIDVAHAALLANNIDRSIRYENCELASEADNEAIVKCKDEKTYRVYLKRLIRPKGIWTAIEVDIK